jgi:hypothetical protein
VTNTGEQFYALAAQITNSDNFARLQLKVATEPNFLRPRSCRNKVVSLAQRRLLYTARTRVLLTSLAVA